MADSTSHIFGPPPRPARGNLWRSMQRSTSSGGSVRGPPAAPYTPPANLSPVPRPVPPFPGRRTSSATRPPPPDPPRSAFLDADRHGPAPGAADPPSPDPAPSPDGPGEAVAPRGPSRPADASPPAPSVKPYHVSPSELSSVRPSSMPSMIMPIAKPQSPPKASLGSSALAFVKDLVKQAGQRMMPSGTSGTGTTPTMRPLLQPRTSEFRPGMELVHGGYVFTIICELGAGCFGQVLKVQRRQDGKVMAVKVQPQLDPRQVMEVRREVELLHRLRHPNIVALFADFPLRTARGHYICIAMEFCGGGTLKRLIQERQRLGMPTFHVFSYLAQLADGLAYIHRHGVAHRDLKSENVMLTEEHVLKIADFGCGKVVPEGAVGVFTLTGGDLMVIPPEFSAIAQGIPQLSLVSPAYDLWGLGCILGEMTTLKLLRQDRCQQRPLSLNPPALAQLFQEARLAHNGVFLPLLQQLLQWEPARRATAEYVANYARQCLRGAPGEAPPAEALALAADLGLPHGECQRLWHLFRQADADHKGRITAEELRSLLAILQLSTSAPDAIRRHDPSGTGALDFGAFLTFWAARDSAWIPTVHADEAADVARIRSVFGIAPEVCTKLQEGFRAADTESSGTISAVAFFTLLGDTLGLDLTAPGQTDAFLEALGPEWPELTLSFDAVLRWCRDHVDWEARALRPFRPSAPLTPVSVPAPAPAPAPLRRPSRPIVREATPSPKLPGPADPPAAPPKSPVGLAEKLAGDEDESEDEESEEGEASPSGAEAKPAGPATEDVEEATPKSMETVAAAVRSLPVVDIDTDAPASPPRRRASHSRPGHPPVLSPGTPRTPSDGVRYEVGETVEVRRSSGAWTAASIVAVGPVGYSVVLADGLGRKDVPRRLGSDLLRHPRPPPSHRTSVA